MMLDFETGRKLTVIRFVEYAAILVLQYIILTWYSYEMIERKHIYIYTRLAYWNGLINAVATLAPLAIAVAFLVKFATNRDMMDALIGGALGLSIVIKLFGIYGHGYIWHGVFTLIGASYLLGMAVRARETNRLLSLFFLAAFLIQGVGETVLLYYGYVLTISNDLLLRTLCIAFLIVVALACAFECSQNNR